MGLDQTKAYFRILKASDMKVLRIIINKSLKERTKSEGIRWTYKIYNINQSTKNRQIEWNDHRTKMTVIIVRYS